MSLHPPSVPALHHAPPAAVARGVSSSSSGSVTVSVVRSSSSSSAELHLQQQQKLSSSFSEDQDQEELELEETTEESAVEGGVGHNRLTICEDQAEIAKNNQVRAMHILHIISNYSYKKYNRHRVVFLWEVHTV